jgi:hypothetical protein
MRHLLIAAFVFLISACLPGPFVMDSSTLLAQGRPAPAPSRYGYTLELDQDSLPDKVIVREVVDDNKHARYFIKNESDIPLIINERFQNEQLVTGSKLVSGKVYMYFPNGVPMEGKQHLKGWQAPFGDMEETLIVLDKEPSKIYEGRKPGLSKEIPEPEAYAIKAVYDGKPYTIKATVRYHLNEAYDKFHQDKTPQR